MDFAACTAMELKNRWRGFQPWPGAFTALDGKKLIVHRLEVVEPARLHLPDAAEPAQLFVDQQRLIVCCAQGTGLEFLELQLEGKKRTMAAEFLRGTHLASGMRLG
jgi:methionyl-tRNA formyltransferase